MLPRCKIQGTKGNPFEIQMTRFVEFVQIRKISRPFEDVVDSDPPKEVNISLNLERKTVVFCDSCFPDVREALHFPKS